MALTIEMPIIISVFFFPDISEKHHNESVEKIHHKPWTLRFEEITRNQMLSEQIKKVKNLNSSIFESFNKKLCKDVVYFFWS